MKSDEIIEKIRRKLKESDPARRTVVNTFQFNFTDADGNLIKSMGEWHIGKSITQLNRKYLVIFSEQSPCIHFFVQQKLNYKNANFFTKMPL